MLLLRHLRFLLAIFIGSACIQAHASVSHSLLLQKAILSSSADESIALLATLDISVPSNKKALQNLLPALEAEIQQLQDLDAQEMPLLRLESAGLAAFYTTLTLAFMHRCRFFQNNSYRGFSMLFTSIEYLPYDPLIASAHLVGLLVPSIYLGKKISSYASKAYHVHVKNKHALGQLILIRDHIHTLLDIHHA